MKAAPPITVTPFPIRLLSGVLALTAAGLLALGWAAYDSYQNFVAVQSHDLRLAELRGTIVYLDEVLTMSARMAATTGDPQWERRYRGFESTLEAAVRETMKLTTQSASAAAAQQTAAANLQLVDLENQAFALVRTAQTAAARNVLFSEAYEAQKKIYATGMAALIEDIEAELATSQRAMWRRTLFFGASVLLVAGLLVLVWVMVLRHVQRWRIALTHAVESQQQRQTELRVLFDLMPAMICFKDTENRVLRINQRFADVVGKSVEEIEGKSFRDLYPTEAARFQAIDLEIIRSGKPRLGIVETMLGPDGQVHWVQKDKVPVWDKAGKVIGIVAMAQDISARKQAEADLEKIHQELVAASRQAGMAEVATGVLHNVGNVLNSVNVSATLVADQVRRSKGANVAKLAALFTEHHADLATFLTRDPRGQMIPGYLATLTESLALEQVALLTELDLLRKNIGHIKDIVGMQQSYARTSRGVEPVALTELVEDALRMNASSLARHDVELVREFQLRPVVSADKHKVMQIVVNLVRNAQFACDEGGRPNKRITVRIAGDAHRVQISVDDNGVGIPAGNLTRIFGHGFTTRQHGHGFGLHSSARAARELGGALTVRSDGPGHGATFVLELPLPPEPLAHENNVS